MKGGEEREREGVYREMEGEPERRAGGVQRLEEELKMRGTECTNIGRRVRIKKEGSEYRDGRRATEKKERREYRKMKGEIK